MKRNWKTFPRRFAESLNGHGGIIGVSGIVFGGGLGLLASGAFAIASVVAGGGAVLCSACYCTYKAIPPRLFSPDELDGKSIRLTELENVHPPVLLLAIVGPSLAGKTTLKDRLFLSAHSKSRTQEITAQILQLHTSPPKFVALLDGSGERLTQQFEIANLCDIMCVVLDHNKGDNDGNIDMARVSKSENDMEQIRHHIAGSGAKQKELIHILANKRDLWETASRQDQQQFLDFCNAEVRKFEEGRYARRVSFSRHSNASAEDITAVMTSIVGTV